MSLTQSCGSPFATEQDVVRQVSGGHRVALEEHADRGQDPFHAGCDCGEPEMPEIEAVVADDRERRGSSPRLQCGRDVCSPHPITKSRLAKQHGDDTGHGSADGQGHLHGNRPDLSHVEGRVDGAAHLQGQDWYRSAVALVAQGIWDSPLLHP